MATQAIDALVRKLRGKRATIKANRGKPDPVRTLAGVIRESLAGVADPCTLMGALVEAAVYTLATRIPVICQDDTAAALSHLVAERLEHYRLLR